MNSKQTPENWQRIPDQEIDFVAAIRQGLAELDRGERIPIADVERDLPSWIIY